MPKKNVCSFLLLMAGCAFAEAPILRAPTGAVTFSPETGAITAVAPKGASTSVWQSGEQGLWAAHFADGSTLDAARFHTTNALFAFSWKPGPDPDALTLSYVSAALTVRVVAHARPDGVELSAEATPATQPLLSLDLPGRLRFDPASVNRFVCPVDGNVGVGAAFNAAFFSRQPETPASGWTSSVVGPAGYVALYGEPPVQRPVDDPPTTLTVTDDGRRWLSAPVAARAAAAKAVVNRPPTPKQAELILVDSANGPYLSASRLGGSGALWRIGGGVHEPDTDLALALVGSVAETLAAAPAAPRARIGLVRLPAGPDRGLWSDVYISDWRARLSAIAARTNGRVAFTELDSPQALLNAARQNDFLCIVNPYGEGLPLTRDDGMTEAIDAVRAYVKAGGHWFEVGGFSFFQSLRPLRYLAYASPYPVAFSDFLHLDSRAGASSLYRVQPRTVKEPWDAAKNPAEIFVPGGLGCGGDAAGGYCDHAFSAYVKPGAIWRTPAVRITLGTPVTEDLARYCAANGLTRTLAEKVKPEALARLRQSVLVYLGGSCREKSDALGRLPVPTLIHFADYLKGGFDKQYPDHLPVRPDFGTPESFKAFFDAAHARGHLVSPYTNPTWWCDHPKGPTFEREGEAPLLKGLDGKPVYERYAQNDGWTITLWHPAVQAANRLTVRQFTQEFPVDVLFQDQCGARGWHYDTNPASPSPTAYSEGMIAMNDEDSRTVPLGTENGWDRVANYQTLLCGMSWAIVPTENAPFYVRPFKDNYPPNTWEIFPLAQAVAHDKAVFLHHDLGQFVTNDQVLTWSLGLGYSLSYSIYAPALAKDAPREWLAWLDRLQKSVCARFIGAPLRDFRHDRAPIFAAGGDPRRISDDGVLRATYGDVKLVCNLGDVPRTVSFPTAQNPQPTASLLLPPYGLRAEAPGMTAGRTAEGVGYVTETKGNATDLWIYAPDQAKVSVPVPLSGRVRVAIDGETTLDTRHSTLGASHNLSLALPQRGSIKRVPPPAALAPREWPGAKPALGVLDLGAGLAPALTSVTPAAWRAAFEASPLVKQYGLTVKTLASYNEIAAALAAGPSKVFAIVNPYGEIFPSAGPGRWQETLDAIHAYVNNGGAWWETAAFSFFRPAYFETGAWKTEHCGPNGVGRLGLPVGGGDVDEPAEPLHATEIGKAWLGDALAAHLAQCASAVNRGTVSSPDAPATVLVAGPNRNFIGGYRLEGWGYLWRIGGFNPNPEVATSVAVEATLHQYTTPPAPLPPAGTRYLYHATLTPASFWQRACSWF